MEDTVDQDVSLLGQKVWKSLALNKEEMKKLLMKAAAHTLVWAVVMKNYVMCKNCC